MRFRATRFGRAIRPTASPAVLIAPVLIGLILAGLSVGAAVLGPATASVPPVTSGWTRVWHDDFNGASQARPDAGRWQYDIGTSYPGGADHWGTGEVETMTNSTANVRTDGAGNLMIIPLRDAAGGWTSGRIETVRTDFQPPSNGIMRVSARIQVPGVGGAAAQGYWPAFWMLGSSFRGNYQNWPRVGEIDVMENVNGVNQVHGTLHCGTSPGGPCNEKTGLGGSVGCSSAPCAGNWHVYSVELDRGVSPQQLRWYRDGVRYQTVTSADVGESVWAEATAHGFFLILNVAVGGEWPGNPTAATRSGVPMLVDYVAVDVNR